MSMVSDITILIILLLLSGFFSGTEVALISVSKIKARTLLNQKRRGAKSLCKLKENPERMIITILIGNNIVNIAATAMATIIATDYFGSAGLGIATGIMTFLILVFGEITPKTFAANHAERVSLLVAKPIFYLSYILYPLIAMFHGITSIIMKLMKIEKTTSHITEEELKTMIEVSAEKDIIDIKEKELLKGVLEFNDIRVGEIMTPRKKMFMANGDMPIKNVLREIAKSKYSRIPVFSKGRDRIVGVVHIRDVLSNISSDKKLKDISAEPVYILKDLTLDETFKLFQLKQTHMAIVADNQKNVVGLVTLEDLMEEIVGEIMDEKDLSPSTIVRIDKHTIVVHGDTKIEKINKFFNINLPVDKNQITIYDFMKKQLKEIKIGEKLDTEEVSLVLDDIKDGIMKIRIIKKKKLFEKIEDHLKK